MTKSKQIKADLPFISKPFLIAKVRHCGERLFCFDLVVDSKGNSQSCDGLFAFGDKTMKEIPLTQGKTALVDDEDFERLNQFKWSAAKSKNTYYAMRQVRKVTILMHREITQAASTARVDHKDRNGLNNQKTNLRFCSIQENLMNQAKTNRPCSSKYKGVHWVNKHKRWKAQIQFNRQPMPLGYFYDEADAAKAYDAKAKELCGEFAYLNFPDT